MNYVLERVPPPHPGLPRPRFSLYLSSQLQYGVIVVYHRQCAILLGKRWSTDWRREILRRAHWFLTLTLCPSRGTSVRRGPAGETEDVPENWYGRPQQVRTGAQRFTHLPALTNATITPVSCCLFPLRQSLDFPDALSLLEEAERAPDPLFGVMYMQDAMPSPNTLIQVPKHTSRGRN